uniref:Protein dpy-30 homolog n=1 Tax=Chlamydomonas leiostraca TaxID=1034604 RepID=A0A7S0WXV9_9CHLO|mmetsp:Transcript_34654/g.87716  ORF Transcript_34654/g.87716 Transcript_34654/m.87716 type:complete len:113 (+) Transcript_34654:72-410(+)
MSETQAEVAAEMEEAPAAPAPPLIQTPEVVKLSEKGALSTHSKISLQSAPIRQYLEASVVPVLMQGLQAVCKERPENPVEYLAYYLLQHNPQGGTGKPAQGHAQPAGSQPQA